MSTLINISPRHQNRVMDLVHEAGLDISDWSNFKGGMNNAASNPKYCYEWSFVDGDKIVLNLWYENMKEHDGTIHYDINMRAVAEKYEKTKKTWSKRASKMDFALQRAVRLSLPVRVIVLEGYLEAFGDKPSSVSKRLLDPLPWTITEYDSLSGLCRIMRGIPNTLYIDQFELTQVDNMPPEKRKNITESFVRSRGIRMKALQRANGKCEWCGSTGFKMSNNQIYLETHHISPLSEDGPDTLFNLAVLCPNHHREAHYGKRAKAMQKVLQKKFKSDG